MKNKTGRMAALKYDFLVVIALTAGIILLAQPTPAGAQESAGEHYARILAEADSMARNNAYLSGQLQSQEAEVARIQQQIADLDGTAPLTVTLVQRMFDSLEHFVASDLPFVDPTRAGPDSRSERMQRLRDLMSDETVPMGEKYRRLMEAYQIELEYGRTMVSYKGKLDDGRDVDFLRVGRVSLMYRTMDGEEAGYWDAEKNSWVAANQYNKAIEKAVLIATKESAPDLVAVPVPAPRGEPQ